MKQFLNSILGLVILIIVIGVVRWGYSAMFSGPSWELIVLPVRSTAVYDSTDYKDSLSCVYAGERALSTAGEGAMFQCAKGCDSDHTNCSEIIDSRHSAVDQKAVDDYVKSLKL